MIEHLLSVYPWVIFLGLVVNWFANFWKTAIYFQNGCTCLHSHQQWRIVPCAPPPLQHKLSVVILILDILVSVRWNLRAILIYISMMSMCELYLRLITWRFSQGHILTWRTEYTFGGFLIHVLTTTIGNSSLNLTNLWGNKIE